MRSPSWAVGAIPAALLAASACAEAWSTHGSIEAGDWLPYAILAGLLVAVALAAGAVRPTRPAATGLGLLFGLAAWQAASAAWSPVPSLARDDALRTVLFALVAAAGTFTLSTGDARVAALWLAALAFGGLAVAAAVDLLVAADPLSRFVSGRLYFPITYSNAQAALFLAGFWPGVVLAARRSASLPERALALGAAGGAAAGALLAQSKGSVVGAVAAVVVVAIVSPSRLRILLTAALAALPAAVAGAPLTAPFRHPGTVSVIRGAGLAVLAATAGAFVLGAAFAATDRRVDLTSRRRTVGRAAGFATVVAALAGVAIFFAAVGSPTTWASERWQSFKHYAPAGESGATHLENLGSNRYDFWRAALRLYERHPVAGCGGWCFSTGYLLDRHSPERPKRSHSLFLDTAAEQGTIGLALLLAALSALFVATGRGARARRGPAIAALAGLTGLVAQSAVDWTWTFPAVGIAYAIVLGAGLADGRRGVLSPRAGRLGATLAVGIVVVALLPTWLSARLTKDALARGAAGSSLRWAHRLDPLSTQPLLAEASLAPNASVELRALRAAVHREPRVVANRYFLGSALLNLGRVTEARMELRYALSLDPGNVSVLAALARTS